MSIHEIDPREAHARLAAFQVVDVRESEELEGHLGRIEDVLHVPLAEVEAAALRLSGAGPLLVVCRSGKRSLAACERLTALGVGEVTNLSGGMIAWNEAGLPVVGAQEAPEARS